MSTTAAIIEQAQKAGPNGVTSKEIRAKLGCPAGTATSRTSTLAAEGKLTKTMVRRDGAYVFVWSGEEAPAPTKTPTITHYTILIDKSGSMASYGNEAKAAELYNRQLKELLAVKGQEIYVSVGAFNRGLDWVTQKAKLSAGLRQVGTFGSMGGTALRDSIAQAIDAASSGALSEHPQVILVFTDGIDEDSQMGWLEFRRKLESAKDMTVAILTSKGQRGHQELLANGVPEGNVRPWETIEQASRDAAVATRNFARERARGVRSTKHYFKANLQGAEADLGNLTLLSGVRVFSIEKEVDFDQLATEKNFAGRGLTRRYYELMKQEKRIPADREVLLLDRRDGKVYGDGAKTVRAVCGWPERGEIAVDVGNHGNFCILVESKSSKDTTHRARILPRGTKAAAR